MSKPRSQVRHLVGIVPPGARGRVSLDGASGLAHKNLQTEAFPAPERLQQVPLPRSHRNHSSEQIDIFLQGAFQFLAIGMCVLDRSGKFVRVNATFCDMLGYEEHELLGRTYLDVTFYEDFFTSENAFSRIMSGGGGIRELEKRYLRKDGRVIWALASASLFTDSRDGNEYLVSQIQEITRQKQLYFDQRDQSTVLALVANGAPLSDTLAVLLRNFENQFPRTTCTIMEFHAEDQTLWMTAAPSIPAHLHQAFNGIKIGDDVGSCGSAAYNRTRVVTHDVMDDSKWVNFRHLTTMLGVRACWSQPIIAGDGTLLGTFAVYRPIPGGPTPDEVHHIERIANLAAIAFERKTAGEIRLQLEEQLHQTRKLESIGLLAGGVAHDFNNLITGILGNTALALFDVGDGSPARTRMLQVQRGAQRASELVSQLLAYAGRGKTEKNSVDLNELVQEMKELLRGVLRNDVELVYQCADCGPVVFADGTQIRQVVMNLITNASDAMGARPGTITVETGWRTVAPNFFADSIIEVTEVEPNYAFISIEDNGCGMDSTTRARIFDPFFTTKDTGRGLGLAAVIGIVRAHRGALKLDSKIGSGTRFEIYFPSTRVPLAFKNTEEKVASARQRTILLSDDEPLVREVARMMLERSGYRVLEGSDGREAIALLKEHQGEVDLAILDLAMPGMSGEEARQEIEKLNPNLPLVLSSGFGNSTSQYSIQLRNNERFLHKPYRLEELLEVVDTCLRLAEQSDLT